MEKQVLAIAVFVLACCLPLIASSVRVDTSFDIHKLSLQFKKREGTLDYYKLALEWPKSVCNTGDNDELCERPIKDYFTIHYLQPYYSPDNSVPPFNKSGCNSLSPSSAETITEAYLTESGILDDMVKYWPNVFGYTNITKNLEFWQYQWVRAGKCSLYPAYPNIYYGVALTYIKSMNLLQILKSEGIRPNNEKYEASAFAAAFEKHLGVKVQIRCNKDYKNTTQFYEVLLCINKYNFLESCYKTKYFGCSATEEIQFPVAVYV